MEKTLVVWHRLGKEHGEGKGCRANPPEVVEEHVCGKIKAFRQTPDAQWRWYRLSDEVLAERRDAERLPCLDNTSTSAISGTRIITVAGSSLICSRMCS